MSPGAVKDAGPGGVEPSDERARHAWYVPVADWRPTTNPCIPLRDKRKGRMMHYFAYSEHKHESYPCRFSVEDAREDILEEMSNGVAIALQGRNYYSVARIGGTMENVLTLDPVDEYDGPYESISTVECGDREWRIEKCYSFTCKAQDRAGDDW